MMVRKLKRKRDLSWLKPDDSLESVRRVCAPRIVVLDPNFVMDFAMGKA